MQSRVSLLADNHTATQCLNRMALLEEIAEHEEHLVDPFVEISLIEPVLVGINNWRSPTLASTTVGPFSLAQRSAVSGDAGWPCWLLNFFAQGSIVTGALSFPQVQVIAGALGLEHNPATDTAISQIQEFRSHTDGWKGANSLGPTERTIDEAKTFAEVVLADSKIEPPHIGLAADGEITFFWQNPKITIDLTITGEGTYAYFAKPAAENPFFEDAAPVTENLPQKILSLIRRAA
jgi:hypothetical protein